VVSYPPHGRSCRRGAFPGDLAVIPLNTRVMVVGSRASLIGEAKLKKSRRSSFVAALRVVTRLGSLFLVALLALGACAPQLNAGEWQCPSDGGTSTPAVSTDPVAIPWSTGFEHRFCDYTELAGSCYGDSAYTIVNEPHHGGSFAAQFAAIGENSDQPMTRCIRQGQLPESAYYGAWYYIPEPLTKAGVWNLFHFDRGDASSDHRMWDVTLVRDTPDSPWELLVYDPVVTGGATYRSPDHIPVPFRTWFHIVLFLKRASDGTGAISLYQDDMLLAQATNLKSNASKFTQWFVGNYATKATPPDSVLYVDDVSITATPPQ